MQIQQRKSLQLLHRGRLVAHPYHVVDSLLGNIPRRHGKVLGRQQIFDGIHCQHITHIRLVIGILLRLLQLFFPLGNLLLGILQLILSLLQLIQPGIDLLLAGRKLGLRHLQLIFSQHNLCLAVGKLNGSGQLTLLHQQQSAVDLLNCLVNIRDLLRRQNLVDLSHKSVISQTSGSIGKL